jgi:hypothetical protein
LDDLTEDIDGARETHAEANGRGPEVRGIVSHQAIGVAVDRRFKDHLVVGVR